MNNDPKDYLSALRRIDDLSNELEMTQKWLEEEKECYKQAAQERDQLRAQLAAAHSVIARWKEFIDECAVAEDRSNLDGDSAEVVLQQVNDGAEEMLKLSPEKVADALAAAQEDVARIDWLDENMGHNGGGKGSRYWFDTPADVECGMLRVAIDAARAKDQAWQEARKE